jgi:hypothetical protein
LTKNHPPQRICRAATVPAAQDLVLNEVGFNVIANNQRQ